MAELTKDHPLKSERSSDEEPDSDLYRRFTGMTPRFASKADALSAAKQGLEKFAGDHGLTVDQLLDEVRTALESKDHHIRALSLECQIGFLSR